jgi:hypothetical protein
MRINLITMKHDVLIPDPPLACLLFNSTTFARRDNDNGS